MMMESSQHLTSFISRCFRAFCCFHFASSNRHAGCVVFRMTAEIFTSRAFWEDSTACAAGNFPGEIPSLPELMGHVLFETSGSSGVPKWIALSKAALLASAAAVNQHLEVEHSSCWGLALPLRHVGGFGVAARAFVAGCQFCEFPQRWNAPAFVDWLAENAVTHASLVPTQVHDLAAAGLRAPQHLRAIVVGGGHLDDRTGRAARELGWPVLASYGMTEAASQIATQNFSALLEPYQSAPLPLLPIWQATTSPEQILHIAGPALFSGMLLKEKDGWSFQRREGDWHATSDRAVLENQMLTPLGRSDLRVKVLGELVDLEMIERELCQLSGGMLAHGMVVVVALPDARTEHSLVPVFDAVVDAAVIHAVLAAYTNTAPGYRRLAQAVVLAPFPRSALGKPSRAEITSRVLSKSS